MKNVLVPVYAHQDWQNVLKYASSIVLRSGAKISFLVSAKRGLQTGIDRFVWKKSDGLPALEAVLTKKGPLKQVEALLQSVQLPESSLEIVLQPENLMQAVVAETTATAYDLVLSGTPKGSLLRRLINPLSLTQLIDEANAPVFLVPPTSPFNEIQHITFAVDLTAYDPDVIRQVKDIAGVFDAKLTIAHVNAESSPEQRETYLNSLERTISDTLDYPKVYYKFFDHADPFRGIKKFVDHSNSQMLAMTNRSPLSWREIFSARSMTMRMTRQSRVPILAFRKKDV